MALFGRDYDETYRPDSWSNRERWARTGPTIRPTPGAYYGPYGARDPAWGGPGDFHNDPYGRDFQMGAYDRAYKSRWQTDYGDPFGDRQQHTPMRVIRGAARGYDAGFWPHESQRNFQRTGYPMGYMPYSARAGYDTGFQYPRTPRVYDRGYDRGWF